MYTQIINSAFSWCVQFIFEIGSRVGNFYEGINISVSIFIFITILILIFFPLVFFHRAKRNLKGKRMARQEPIFNESSSC
jgi:uncharacterized membrane protein